MSDLTDFLLARIAEDEESVRLARADMSGAPWGRYDPDRAEAECEAKRLELDELERMTLNGGDAERSSAIYLLHVKAAVYADHPDYREEWRP